MGFWSVVKHSNWILIKHTWSVTQNSYSERRTWVCTGSPSQELGQKNRMYFQRNGERWGEECKMFVKSGTAGEQRFLYAAVASPSARMSSAQAAGVFDSEVRRRSTPAPWIFSADVLHSQFYYSGAVRVTGDDDWLRFCWVIDCVESHDTVLDSFLAG